MDQLIASDVMNSTDLCYVYPVTRVRSVEKLLRTTAHGAFLVVTPVNSADLFQRKRKKRSPTEYPRGYCHIGGEVAVNEAASVRQNRSCSDTHSLPQQRRDQRNSMGTKTQTYTDEKDRVADSVEDEALLFHGVILRSQLVEMLKNGIFFEESQGVSPRLITS